MGCAQGKEMIRPMPASAVHSQITTLGGSNASIAAHLAAPVSLSFASAAGGCGVGGGGTGGTSSASRLRRARSSSTLSQKMVEGAAADTTSASSVSEAPASAGRAPSPDSVAWTSSMQNPMAHQQAKLERMLAFDNEALSLQYPSTWECCMDHEGNTVIVQPGVGVLHLRVCPEILSKELTTDQYALIANEQVRRAMPYEVVIADTTMTVRGVEWRRVEREFPQEFKIDGAKVCLDIRQCTLMRTEVVGDACVAFAHTWTCTPSLWHLYNPIFERISESIEYKM